MRQTAGEEDEESQEDEDEVEDEEMMTGGAEDDEQEAEEVEPVLYDEKAVEWMMQQLCMYQTRTALISNPLAEKGFKLREIVPSPRGLLCAVSTEERRMDCRMYVEAEVGKKASICGFFPVVAPCKCKGTQKWISFSALNSERRKEATKWKNCPTCQGPIDYALYEAYGGGAGKAVSAILNNSRATRVAIGVLATMVVRVVVVGTIACFRPFFPHHAEMTRPYYDCKRYCLNKYSRWLCVLFFTDWFYRLDPFSDGVTRFLLLLCCMLLISYPQTNNANVHLPTTIRATADVASV
ncbi:unnamed protein product [Ectocarpus sp. 4 AP-2014]